MLRDGTGINLGRCCGGRASFRDHRQVVDSRYQKMQMGTMDRKRAAKAIEGFDAEALREALDDEPAAADGEELTNLVLRSNRMIFRKADAVAESSRSDFLSDLRTIYAARYHETDIAGLNAVISAIDEIEAGYRDIQSGVPLSAIAALPKSLQISAVIERAIIEAQILARQAHDALKSGGWQPGLPIIAHDDEGNAYDVDGVRTVLVRNLGATLKFLMDRFGRNKVPTPLILPNRVSVAEEDTYKAGTALLASAALRRWRRIDERVRFWGGKIQSYRPPQLPAGSNVDLLRVYTPGRHPVFDVIANQRLADVLLKSFSESLLANLSTVDPRAEELAPSAFLSTDEHAAYGTLTGLLGGETHNNETKYQGLSIAEWIRGYAALRQIAAEGEDSSPRQVSFNFRPGELEDHLLKVGLKIQPVQRFLQCVTFGDHSDDLFDCPVISFSDGSHLLFGPAAAHSVIPQIVLSNLGQLGERFKAKGPSFERTVRRNFERAGLKPTHIHTFREGEEYEIDVVLPWQGKLFLIECKTDALSDGDPVAAYNFERARDKHITQVKRQIAGLRAHPDMLQEKGIADPGKFEWIPVLLYLFPYAMPVDDRGVYIADWAGLGRFFGAREVNLPPVLHSETLHRAVMHSRQGKIPTAEDLKAYLSAPFQVELKLASIGMRQEVIWLQDRKLAHGVELDFSTPNFADLKERLPNITLGHNIELTQPG